ncbi:hypothetical protein KBD71_02115 [Candidatus Woesebacteria bacterium]|nr:hypothetical protein [Candidatus Woesebacteria bacterium]
MSDDKQNSPVSKSVSNASLDDILSSLEQQLNTSASTSAPASPEEITTAKDSSAVETTPAMTTSAPEAPELETKAVGANDIELTATPPSFAVEEKPVDPIAPFTPPSITPVSSELQEKPVLKAENPVDDQTGIDAVIEPSNFMGSGIVAAKEVMKEHTTTQPDDAPPAPAKKKAFGINPSMVMGAVVALVLMVGSVAAVILQRQDQSLIQRATSESCDPGTGSLAPAGWYRIDAEIQCDSSCGVTGGKICKTDGTYSSCINNTHACGSIPGTNECNISETDSCQKLGYAQGVTCQLEGNGTKCKGTGDRFFVGCGTGNTVTNSSACDNCYRYPDGNVQCFREPTSCGAKSSCQTIVATTPPTTYSCPAPASCVGPNTPNGQLGQNCGSWGMVDGGGTCSSGGFCCKPNTYVDRCDWNHGGAGTTCTGDGVNRQYNNGVPTRPACCGGLVEDGYGTCGCAPATPVPTPVPTPTPTPTPTATPTATPTPTPTPTGTPLAAVCMSITKDIQAPKLGNQVRFTCGTATNATRYEFRWKVGSTVTELNPISSGSNISVPLTITTAGVYKAQCRPCVGNSCTEWEAF